MQFHEWSPITEETCCLHYQNRNRILIKITSAHLTVLEMILILSRWQFDNCANTDLPHRWFLRLWVAAPNRNTPVSMFQTGTVMKIYNYRFLECYICWTTKHHRTQLCLAICQQRTQSKYFWPWSVTINVAYLRDLIVMVFPKHDVLTLNRILPFSIKNLPEVPDGLLWDGTRVSAVWGHLLPAWAMLFQILLELQSLIMFLSNIWDLGSVSQSGAPSDTIIKSPPIIISEVYSKISTYCPLLEGDPMQKNPQQTSVFSKYWGSSDPWGSAISWVWGGLIYCTGWD